VIAQFPPEWAKKAVWYQIFPERFCNGNPDNDPTLADQRGAWPHDLSEPWQIHPWTSDWYERQPYEQAHPHRDIWFHLQRRRYGGDLQGILNKLDYLQDLGVTALYLCPVFSAPSSHKYDGATYHHIDPNLGPDPQRDRKALAKENPADPSTWIWTQADLALLTLIQEIHRRSMHLILDGVFNHVGVTFWAFQDLQEKQQRSAYRDWFKVTSWDDPLTGKTFDYQGWFGFRELPEWKQDTNGIVQGPRDYIFQATRRWMDPYNNGELSAGIDGWRLDVAFCVAHPFWQEWRRLVKSINPQAYLTAEVIDAIPVLQPYLQGDEFDAVMNYNFAFCCAEYFINQKTRISTSAFDQRLRDLRQAFPAEVAYAMQNLYDSHDTPRLPTLIANPDGAPYRQWRRHSRWSQAQNPRYRIAKPTPQHRQIQKLMALFQMTYVGSPMIYYGDEAGMWGANDPCCRQPMLWPDRPYAPARFLPDGSTRREAEVVAFDHELHQLYRRLIHLRNRHPALQCGDFQTLLVNDEERIYVFSRSCGEEQIIVALNNSPHRVNCCLKGVDGLHDLWTEGASVSVDSSGAASFEIAPFWARLFAARRSDGEQSPAT